MTEKKRIRTTRWHVITGAPCSGKTTVIAELERLGYPVVHEVARAVIAEGLEKGTPLEMIKADRLAFERRILQRKIEIEAALSTGATVFLDRAVPDSIAYFAAEGLDPKIPRAESLRVRYRTIFLFERLGIEKDPVRSETEAAAEKLERLIEDGYRSLGYAPVRVPLLPVADRVRFILGFL
jgi:predicted ATPase